MREIIIRLKSGREINVICDEYEIQKNGFGAVIDIKFVGLKNIRPIILDLEQIELAYEVLRKYDTNLLVPWEEFNND